MRFRRKIAFLAALLLAGLLILTGCAGGTAPGTPARTAVTQAAAAVQATAAPAAEETGPIIRPQEIADYIFEHGELPGNFITKEEAMELGWDSGSNYVSDVAPGRSLGGDRYGNYQKNLPYEKGRKYFECDCNYTGGKRGAERIVYSNDGHVWYSDDHYQTFTELFPSSER